MARVVRVARSAYRAGSAPSLASARGLARALAGGGRSTPRPSALPRDFSTGAVRVRGLSELVRDLRAAAPDVARELRSELREAAEPVRATAEGNALREIRNVGREWSQMRVGVTTRSVYVAPRQRGVTSLVRQRFKRRNLAGLLMERAMDPALETHRGDVVGRAERALETALRKNDL